LCGVIFVLSVSRSLLCVDKSLVCVDGYLLCVLSVSFVC